MTLSRPHLVSALPISVARQAARTARVQLAPCSASSARAAAAPIAAAHSRCIHTNSSRGRSARTAQARPRHEWRATNRSTTHDFFQRIAHPRNARGSRRSPTAPKVQRAEMRVKRRGAMTRVQHRAFAHQHRQSSAAAHALTCDRASSIVLLPRLPTSDQEVFGRRVSQRLEVPSSFTTARRPTSPMRGMAPFCVCLGRISDE